MFTTNSKFVNYIFKFVLVLVFMFLLLFIILSYFSYIRFESFFHPININSYAISNSVKVVSPYNGVKISVDKVIKEGLDIVLTLQNDISTEILIQAPDKAYTKVLINPNTIVGRSSINSFNLKDICKEVGEYKILNPTENLNEYVVVSRFSVLPTVDQDNIDSLLDFYKYCLLTHVESIPLHADMSRSACKQLLQEAQFELDMYVGCEIKDYEQYFEVKYKESIITSNYRNLKNKIKAKNIINKLNLETANNMEKIIAITYWVTDTCQYSQFNYSDYSAIGVFDSGRAACAGYSIAAYYLLSSAGVENKIVIGEPIDSSAEDLNGHAWNQVNITDYHSYSVIDFTNTDVYLEAGFTNLLEIPFYLTNEDRFKTEYIWSQAAYEQTANISQEIALGN